MKQVTPLSAHWEDVYHANLLNARLAPGGELINHTFELAQFRSMDGRAITNPAREFRRDFSDVMARWILSGQVHISDEMIALNPNAAKFNTLFKREGIEVCTAYGPRLLAQLDFVVGELRRDPNSRRACVMMLGADDRHVAEALGAGSTACEYLCTYAFNFRLRNGMLDLAASMRSNNYTTTVCQDVYVFALLQQEVAARLGVPVGRYYHSTVSGHIFEGEGAKADRILDAYVAQLRDINADMPLLTQASNWGEALAYWERNVRGRP